MPTLVARVLAVQPLAIGAGMNQAVGWQQAGIGRPSKGNPGGQYASDAERPVAAARIAQRKRKQIEQV